MHVVFHCSSHGQLFLPSVLPPLSNTCLRMHTHTSSHTHTHTPTQTCLKQKRNTTGSALTDSRELILLLCNVFVQKAAMGTAEKGRKLWKRTLACAPKEWNTKLVIWSPLFSPPLGGNLPCEKQWLLSALPLCLFLSFFLMLPFILSFVPCANFLSSASRNQSNLYALAAHSFTFSPTVDTPCLGMIYTWITIVITTIRLSSLLFIVTVAQQ